MSAFQDKHGQWWAQIDIGFTLGGKRKYARRKATSKRDALTIERRLLRERDAGTLLDTRELVTGVRCDSCGGISPL